MSSSSLLSEYSDGYAYPSRFRMRIYVMALQVILPEDNIMYFLSKDLTQALKDAIKDPNTFLSPDSFEVLCQKNDCLIFYVDKDMSFYKSLNFLFYYKNHILQQNHWKFLHEEIVSRTSLKQHLKIPDDLVFGLARIYGIRINISFINRGHFMNESYGQGEKFNLFFDKGIYYPIQFLTKDFTEIESFLRLNNNNFQLGKEFDILWNLDELATTKIEKYVNYEQVGLGKEDEMSKIYNLKWTQEIFDMNLNMMLMGQEDRLSREHELDLKLESQRLDQEKIAMWLEDQVSQNLNYPVESPTKIYKGVYVVSPDSDTQTLYSYMLNSELMICSSISELLEAYNILHNIILDRLEIMNKNGLMFPHDFLKAFSKFRHNVFGVICKKIISDVPHQLGTDMPLTKYINSKKTPDFIIENGEIILMDFTVGNRYDSVDFIKGGGNFDKKYDLEARMITDKLGINCRSVIVPAVLDNYNILEILEILDPFRDNHKDFNTILDDFFKISNKDRFLINLNNVKSYNTTVKLPFEGHNLKSYDRPPLRRVINLNAEILSLVSENMNYIRDRLFRSLERRTEKVDIVINLESNRIEVSENKKGINLKKALDDFDKFDPSKIFQLIKFKDSNGFVPFNKLSGTIPVTIGNRREIIRDTKWSYNPINDKLWNEKEIFIKLEYGELEQIGLSNMLPLEDDDKVAFPPNYFEKLSNLDFEPLLNCKSEMMLANCKVDENHIKESIIVFDDELKVNNSLSNKLFRYTPRPTFLYPFITAPLSTTTLDKLNNPMMKMFVLGGQGEYTKNILKKILNNNFCPVNKKMMNDSIRLVRDELSDLNRKLYRKVLELNNGKATPFRDLDKESQTKAKGIKEDLRIKQQEFKNLMGNTKGIIHERIVKLSCGKKSQNRGDFEKEMAHYENKGSFKGVGFLENDLNALFGKYLVELIDRLVYPNFHDMDLGKLYNSFRHASPKFLTDMKNLHTERFDTFFKNFFSGTLLEQLCEFNQRLSGFLFNESLKSYNKDYIKVDNLGFDNIIVLLRGGPKLYKNQRSRLFRVFFYIEEKDLKFSGYKENPNFQFFRSNGKCLIVSPWSQIHQDVLMDHHSISYRTFMNLFVNYTRSFSDFSQPIPRLHLFPFLLSLHNRRKTEQFMHNSRYLIVNPLGANANIKGIIKSFADFNYGYMDSWLRYRISQGYEDFALKLFSINKKRKSNIDLLLSQIDLKDLWLGEPLINADHLTTFIYITYMMTKAPVNSSIEQASNLWEILDDIKNFDLNHGDVVGLKDDSLRSNILDFDISIYGDDFKYDPVFCQYLGHHLAGYLNSSSNPLEYHNYWERLKKDDMDTIANSNGLRGWKPENYFNKKGYEIVFQKIDDLTKDEDLFKCISNYLDSDLVTSNSLIKEDKLTLPKEDYKDLIFHVVHKIQRGGGREIFCMDITTKLRQSPVEKMFKMICKKLPNEFISIPSNKRHGLIHSDFYEKPVKNWVNETVRWVLDCRRWAPHSVFQKYMHFIHGLSPLLPSDFVNEFMNFSYKMFDKKFVTREHVLSKMRNNDKFKPYHKYVSVMNQVADGYMMTVKFSFVMGIFNYLSTLMHAANQIVASEAIRNNLLVKNYGLVIMDAKCHSDDSVLSSYHEKENSIRPSVLLYDWFLKNANHMLSIKKSQVNHDVYLEFLSILYVFDRFLPVVPKFASTLPFKPSDNGYGSDITFAITQSVEMLSQGGNFEESFLIMKLTEKYIQRVYNITHVVDLPFQFLGGIDSHPLELLYSGGMADLARMKKMDADNFWKIINYFKKTSMMDISKAELSLNWDMGAKLGDRLYKKFERLHPLIDKLEERVPWVLNNCKLGNAKLNLLWYVNKLRDRKFYSSLVDEPSARRFSRIFGAGNYRDILDLSGARHDVVKLTTVLSKYKDLVELDSSPIELLDKYLDIVNKDLYMFYDSLEGTNILEFQVSNLKDKPITFRTGESTLGNLSIGATDFVAYEREPDGYKLLGKRNNPFRDVEKIKNHMNVIGITISDYSNDQLLYLTRKVLREDSRDYRLISPVRGDKRRIETYSEVLSMIEYNSIKKLQVILKNKKASIVDWEKKIIQGKVPGSVRDYIKCYWVCNIISEYEVDDLDIYTKHPFEKEKELVNEMPMEWKVILLNSVESEGVELAYVNFWSYWDREQVKIMGKWYGNGSCFISLPELFMKISVSNGIVQNLTIETDYSGDLPSSTSWYLNSFFRNSGIYTEFANSEFGSIDQLYLGFKYKEGIFGIGRAKSFDIILMQTKFSNNLRPSFLYRKMNREKKYNAFIYRDTDGKEYKINFFVPVDEKFVVDLSEYIDTNKIPLLINDSPKLLNFVQSMSIEHLGFAKMDFDYLLDNIGRSTIYKVLRSSSTALSVYRDEKTELEVFMFAIMEWKKFNPLFGFPTEEEMSEFIKRRDLPPIPRKVYNLLIKLGHTNINTMEYENIIHRISTLEDDERENYLITSFPQLSTEYKIESLVLAIRSKRIFDSCKIMGDRATDVLSPLIKCISKILDNNLISSSILESYRSRFGMNNNLYKPQSYYLEVLFTRILMNAAGVSSIFSNKDQLQGKLMDIIVELLDEGLTEHLNYYTSNDPLLRTVEFKVENTVIKNWFVDLLDALYLPTICRGGLRFSDNSRKLYGEGGKLNNYMSYFRQHAIRMSQYTCPNNLKVFRGKSRKETILKVQISSPGVVDVVFKPLTEDAQDEFDSGYSFDPDISECYEFDDDIELPELIYTRTSHLDLLELIGLRGGAMSVLIGCHSISLDLLGAYGKKYFYIRNMETENIYSHLDSCSQYLFLITNEGMNLEIENFKKINDEDVLKRLRSTKYLSDEIMIEGKKYSKSEAISNQLLRSKLGDINQYFRKMNEDIIESESRIVDKKMKIIRSSIEPNEKFQKYSDELESRINEFRQRNLSRSNNESPKEEISKEEEKADQQGMDWENLKTKLSSMLGEFDNKILEDANSAGERSMSKLENEYIPFSFKEPMKLLSDIRFKSEFETLFPGYWNKFVNNEILLTKRSKKYKLQFAELRINQMPNFMRKKYRKLLLIVKFMFTNIVECNNVQQEDHEFNARTDDLFDIDFEPDVENLNILSDLSIEEGDNSIKLDLSFLKKD